MVHVYELMGAFEEALFVSLLISQPSGIYACFPPLRSIREINEWGRRRPDYSARESRHVGSLEGAPFTAGRPTIILGWIATGVMGAAAVRMIIPG